MTAKKQLEKIVSQKQHYCISFEADKSSVCVGRDNFLDDNPTRMVIV